ncbi:hypothetical protein LCGC14_1798360 [marine sediment metagenome]|uniref:HNH endonuclease n=1 Tax=marine sediment metagenome TaxID=412755 RepID=A0A0F9J553_9ZZZZ
MTRRSLTPKRKREIAAFNGWRTPQGEQVAIENGELVTLHDGRKIEYDHIYQIGLGGSDETQNMQPMTPGAHKVKTRDAKARAKDRRLTGVNKVRAKRSWPKGRKLGIPGLRKKLDGRVVRCD